MDDETGMAPHPSPAEQAAAQAYTELCDKVVHAFNHNIRTPLTTLLWHTELLLATDCMPVAALDSLDAMRRTGQMIKAVLADVVLAVDAADTGPAGRLRVHLTSLLRAAVREVRSASAEAVVAVSTNGVEDLVALVNPLLLRRGVAEMLQYAVSRTPPGSPVDLSATIEAGDLCIEVRDGGPEAERRVAPHLGGTGLGVAECVAAAHGGRLVLTDLAGGGRSVTLRLDLLTIGTT
jgi:signal transduction histidine kinase